MVLPWDVPVVQAPVGPATTTRLVKAVSSVGALGTLAASWTEPDVLRKQLQELRASAGPRFCVNLVLTFDQRPRLEVVLDEGVRFVWFSWGIEAALIRRAHDAGAVVLVQVSDVEAAREAADAGADVIVAQGVEAGGHVQGTTPLLELLGALRPTLELPIVAAGGIADGASAHAAIAAGSDGVACGTAFLAALEADVHPDYLERLFRSVASDTVLTKVFDIGWPDAPHRVIRNDTFVNWDLAGRPARGSRPSEDDVIATRSGIPVLRYSEAQPTADTAGEIGSMALYAGMSVDMVHHRASAEDITREIARGLPLL
ncbi:MAG: nitronate monooxygenase [Actinobacteria bacterium]|nr:nitronate monooxygenase [Actinomycetota bacterium]